MTVKCMWPWNKGRPQWFFEFLTEQVNPAGYPTMFFSLLWYQHSADTHVTLTWKDNVSAVVATTMTVRTTLNFSLGMKINPAYLHCVCPWWHKRQQDTKPLFPCTPDATREAKQIRMRKSYCSNRTVYTAGNKQCMMQQATKWDLAPFFRVASCVASSVHGASEKSQQVSHFSWPDHHARCPWPPSWSLDPAGTDSGSVQSSGTLPSACSASLSRSWTQTSPLDSSA